MIHGIFSNTSCPISTKTSSKSSPTSPSPPQASYFTILFRLLDIHTISILSIYSAPPPIVEGFFNSSLPQAEPRPSLPSEAPPTRHQWKKLTIFFKKALIAFIVIANLTMVKEYSQLDFIFLTTITYYYSTIFLRGRNFFC